MRNRGTGLCIDNATENSLKVQSWKCSDGHPSQQWQRLFDAGTGRFMFMNRNTGLCLDLGADQFLVMSPCVISFTKPSHTWTVFFAFNEGGWYQLWQNGTGLGCMAGGTGNGSLLRTNFCHQSFTDQRWSFVVP